MEETDIILHIRMNRELHNKIKAKAKELGLTVPAYLRMIASQVVTP